MNIMIRAYQTSDLPDMIRIWNEVVEDGAAFPQEDFLNEQTGSAFSQNRPAQQLLLILIPVKYMACTFFIPIILDAVDISCNASYAVSRDSRGLHIGEKLVSDCLKQGAVHGFRVLQFNAVVASNIHARHLYERLGFQQLGVIPGGFRMKDGHYEDICPYYHTL